MGYNVIDLIDKAIDLAVRRKLIYKNIGKQKCDIPSIKVMSKVLIKQTDKTIEHYEDIKRELGNATSEEIDFHVYDKISFLINEFNRNIHTSEIHNVRELLKFSLDLERDTYSLLIDIQGRLIKNESDIYTKTYEILSDSINNKAKHIKTLEEILNK